MTPRVSVVIPTFNRADLLPRAIDSVLAQETPPDEIIVVDDCSTDNTPAVLAAYGDRVQAHRHERNSERGGARNAGAAIASGDLLAFLDSDDEWEPSKLRRQLERWRPRTASVTAIRYIDTDGEPTGTIYTPEVRQIGKLLSSNILLGSPSSILLERETFLCSGGFPTTRILQGSEDWIFLVKLLRCTDRITVVAEPLVRYRIHAGGSTQEADNLARSMWWACDWMDRRRIGSSARRTERRSRAAAAIATAYMSEGRIRDALPWARRSLGQGAPRVRARAAWRLARTGARVTSERLSG